MLFLSYHLPIFQCYEISLFTQSLRVPKSPNEPESIQPPSLRNRLLQQFNLLPPRNRGGVAFRAGKAPYTLYCHYSKLSNHQIYVIKCCLN